MKKQLPLLVVGMVLVVIGALLKINKTSWSNAVLIAGLAFEVIALGSLVYQSLKKIK